MSEFLTGTAVVPLENGQFEANLNDGWTIGTIANGGYMMATAARALAQVLPHPDPVTITGHFVDRGEVGTAQLHTEVIRQGNQFSTGCVRLMQQGRERVRFTATFGDLSAQSGASFSDDVMPEAPAPEHCVIAPRDLNFTHRIDMAFPPEHTKWFTGDLNAPAEHVGYIRFADGTPPDLLGLLIFADAFPPTIFTKFGPSGWVPTLELTVHLRAKPVPGWLLARFRTRYMTNGLLEEDGEIWDSSGQLVALSRQLAKARMIKTS